MTWRAGRCCCERCEYFADKYDRPDDASPGAAWSLLAGSAEILSNQLRITASNSALATVVETPTSVQLAKATIRAGTTGDRGRVLVRATDVDNYLFGEVQFGATDSTLRIFRRNAGVNTQLGTNITLSLLGSSDPCTLKVCFYGNTLTAQAYENTILKGTVASVVSVIPTGLATGVGTGAITSAVTFDDFAMLKHNEVGHTECDECAPMCTCCDASYAPFRQYLLDLGAGGLGNQLCSACDTIAGEYFLTPSGNGATCLFNYRQVGFCTFNSAGFPCTNQQHCLAVEAQHVCSGFPTPTSAKWRATIAISNGAGPNCLVSPECSFSRQAVYESAELISVPTRCQDLPCELFKVSDTFASTGGGVQFCTGSLPSSIWLRSAA